MTIKDYFATTTRQMATMAATTTRRAMMTLLVILLTTATTAWADTVTLTAESGEVKLQNGDVLTGTGGVGTHIKIAAGATVTLSGVDIYTVVNHDETQYPWPAISCEGNAVIILADGTYNRVKSNGASYPGIYIPSGKTLTIRGKGSLEASNSGQAAAIGAGWGMDCGNIRIEDGNITADGVGKVIFGDNISPISAQAAGIGGCGGGDCGDITITGGTVTAYGADGAAAIGGGCDSKCGNITIPSGVTYVRAYHVLNSPYAIGPGKNGTCGTVTIGGVTGYITANPYVYAPRDVPYTVTFNANDGTDATTTQGFYSNTPQALTANPFTRTDYALLGWNTKADGSGGEYADGAVVNNLGDATLYAQWEPVNYNIAYILDEGVNADSNPATYTIVSDAITLADPTRIGFIFDGWTFEGQDTPIKRPTIATGSYGDKTFTAHWTLDPVVTLTADMGEVKLYDGHTLTGTGGPDTHVVIASGATVTLSGATITGNGHYSAGIRCLGDATIILADGTTNTVKGGHIRAGIHAGPGGKTLTITGGGTLNATGGSSQDFTGDGCAAIGSGFGYDINSCGNIVISGGVINATGGKNSPGIGAGYGTYCGNITITNTVTSVTATAGRKSPSSIGTGIAASCGTVTIGGTVTGPIAQSPVTYDPSNTATYTVSFNKNANDAQGSMGNQQFTANKPNALSACAFTREGYIFDGWNTEADGSGTAYTNKQTIFATSNMTLYAQWREPKQFTLTFNANGGTGTMEPQTFYEGQAQNLNQCTFTNNSGYYFAVWNTQADGNGTTYTNRQSITIDSDMTLYAQWMEHEATTVTLNYNTGDVTLYDGDILTGTGGPETHVTIADGATVMLSGVKIENSADCPGITCAGDATLIIKGNNVVKGGVGYSGIYIPSGKTLTIRGNGSLTASGDMGAGIGAHSNKSCGTIIIESGTIRATGGSASAGIGGFSESHCDGITIGSGVTCVKATMGNYAISSIGAGTILGSCGPITIAPGLVDVTSGKTRTIAAPATAPTITVQPTGIELAEGYGSGSELAVEATAAAGHTLSYQWYSNTASSTSDGTLIDGATAAVYAVPTGKTGGTTEYYYCIVTATRDDNGQTKTATSNVATITITPPDVTGSGTEQDPYVISSAKGLNLMAERVNGGTNGYASAWYELGDDISFDHGTAYNEHNFDGIGLYDDYDHYIPFCGHFDGKGHTISGIRIYKGGEDEENYANSYQGLFGWIGSGAEVKNVTLRDARITGHTAVGGIAGLNSGTVSNCYVGSDVIIHALAEDASDHGGIAGYNMGTVTGCVSAATVSIDDGSTFGYTEGPKGCQYYGGIVGYNYEGTLSGNLALGATVSAASNNTYGAIAGYSQRTGSQLLQNYYSGCNVAGVANAHGVGVGVYYDADNSTFTYISDISDNDGACSALRDGADNSDAIALMAAMPATLDLGWGAGKYPVQLAGRTLYKDGKWNTLCLPFSIELEGSLLDGDNVDVRTLISSEFEDETLTLTFSEKGAVTTIEAGKPYIIKWDESGTDLTESDLVFQGVSASSTAADVMTDYVDFRGTFSPIVIYESGAEKHYFYLGGDNMLYWPSAVGFQVRSCRAWFVLKNGLTAGEKKSDVRAISLDFGDGDETTGIVDIEHGTWNIEYGTLNNEHLAGGAWYDLSGRKLSGKPTAKGLYIHNGKKRIIK